MASRSSRWRATKGAEVIDLGIARDKVEDIAKAVRRARDMGADVLLTSGGASVGEHDLVQRALATEGLDLSFWRRGVAAGPADDAWHAWVPCRCWACRAIRSRPTSAPSCSWCR